MTAPLALSDIRALRDLAGRWEHDRRAAAFAVDLHAVLDEIDARRTTGPDFLNATVRGYSLPEMEALALAKGTALYGPDAKLEVVKRGDVDSYAGGRFSTCIRLHCLNYAEVSS